MVGAKPLPSCRSMRNNLAGSPDVAFDSDGNATAVWSQLDEAGDPFQWRIRSAIWRPEQAGEPAGGWSEPTDVFGTYASSSWPQIAFDSQGNCQIVWQDHIIDQGWHVLAATRSLDGSWSEPVIAGAGGGPAQQPWPQLAVGANGDTVAVWETLVDDDPVRIWAVDAARRSQSGWGTPRRLTAEGAQSATGGETLPRVAVDSTGAAVALWRGGTNEDSQVWLSTLDGAELSEGAGEDRAPSVESDPLVEIGEYEEDDNDEEEEPPPPLPDPVPKPAQPPPVSAPLAPVTVPAPADTTKPEIKRLKLTTKRISRKRLRRKGKKAFKIRYNLTEQAKVEFKLKKHIKKRLRRMRRKRCKKEETRSERSRCRKRAKAKFKTVARFSEDSDRGENRVKLPKKVVKKLARTGSYKIEAIATDDAGNESRQEVARLRVLWRR